MTSGQRRLIFVLAGLSALAGIATFTYIIWVTIRDLSSPPPATADDRRLVVTIEALQPFGAPPPHAEAENLSTLRQFDGTRTISYEYDSRKGPKVRPNLVASTTTMVHSTSLSAMQAFKVQEVATKTGVAFTKTAKLVDAPGLLLVGDSRYAGVIRYDGKPGGNLFLMRQGKVIFTVVIVGIVFDDPKDVQRLMGPLAEEAKKRF